jgi:hypothetical protein
VSLQLSLRELGDNTFALKIRAAMPRYNLFLYDQQSRVRYPETLNLPDLDAAQHVARRVANVFMEVVPYWGDLSPDQQHRYVVEIVDEAGSLLLTVPFKERTRRRHIRLKQRTKKKRKPHRDSSTDGAGEFKEERS